jgi:RimJ/RimL family protein N-acetyltransferase
MDSDLHVIRSPRLDLRLMSVRLMQALLSGDWSTAEAEAGAAIPEIWTTDDWYWLGIRLGRIERDPSVHPWLDRVMMRRDGGPAIVGGAGFHGPPDARGMVEMGYGVAPEHRRRGYARESVRALMEWAAARPDVRTFRASIGPWNEPSLGLIRGLGFVQVGTQWDERDGEELVFELSAPGS